MPIPEKIIIPASKDPGMGHFAVSLVKSLFRLVASGVLAYAGYNLWTGEIMYTDFFITDVGFYIMHTGGLNFVPIMIGKSKITIQASGNDNSNDAVKVFVDDASIEDSHYGWGWKKFFSLKDLRQSFVNSKGEIQVSATVRVKRVRSCRLATAL